MRFIESLVVDEAQRLYHDLQNNHTFNFKPVREIETRIVNYPLMKQSIFMYAFINCAKTVNDIIHQHLTTHTFIDWYTKYREPYTNQPMDEQTYRLLSNIQFIYDRMHDKQHYTPLTRNL